MLKAETIVNNETKNIQCILVLEGCLNSKLVKIMKKLNVKVLENIIPS